MPQLPDSLSTFLDTLRRIDAASVVDIVLIAALIYAVLIWLKGSTGMSLVKGAAFVVIAGLVLGSLLNLTAVTWLLRNSVPALLVAVPIVFQPELRRALERLGRTRVATRRGQRASETVIDVLVQASLGLAARQLGALIVIERDTGMDEYIRTGVAVDAIPSVDLVINLFWRNSPLHDGAMIVRENRVAAAGCTLPLSETPLPGHIGTRHRAAIGLTERTDAAVIVVSEETGAITVAVHGQFLPNLDGERLQSALRTLTRAARAPLLVVRTPDTLDTAAYAAGSAAGTEGAGAISGRDIGDEAGRIKPASEAPASGIRRR
jgi:diadenylate cyclase